MHRFLAQLKVRDASARAKEMILRQRYEQALAFATEAHALAVQHLDNHAVEYVLAFHYLAAARFNTKDEKGAIELLESVATDAVAVLSEIPEERQALLNNLAVSYLRGQQPEKAIPLMEKVVADKAKTFGENSLELLGNLHDLAQAFDDAGRFGEAETTIRHLLQILEIEFGAESREYVQTLSNLAACLRHAKKKKGAALVRKRIDKLTGVLEEDRRGERLEREARQAYLEGDFTRAKRLHRGLLARTPTAPLPHVFTSVMGDIFDPLVQYATELDRDGVEAEKNGELGKAIQRYRSVVEIFSVSSDDYGIQRAQALNNLALAHQRAGEFEAARHWFGQAVAFLGPLLFSEKGEPVVANVVALFWAMCDRDAPDPSSDFDAAFARLGEAVRNKGKDYARSLRARFPVHDPDDDPAEDMRKWIEARIVFYLSFGAVEPARALHAHLLDLHELLFARDPGRILEPLLSFVAFCVERGPAPHARALLNRATALSAEALGEVPTMVAETLRWEARFRSANGDNASAEEALLSAREFLAERSVEKAALAAIENDLLVVWLRLGKKGEEMDELLDRAIASSRKNLRFENPQAVQHLASLLSYRKDWDGAEALSRQALAKQKETIGEWDPQYGLTLSNLANLLRMRGRAAEAAPLLRQAVKIRELEFEAQHQLVARSRIRLALALGAMGQWDEAMSEMEQVLQANEVFLQATVAVTSREQLFHALQQERLALDIFISMALRLPEPRRATRLSYEAILRRKGLGAEALAARRLPLLSERYPRQRAALAELDHISSILSEHLVSSRHSVLDLREARARKQQLETELAAAIPEMRFEAVWRSADAGAIRETLEEDCVLLEYAQFRPFNFDGVVTEGDPEIHPPRYLGFAVAKHSEVEMVDLGDAAEIDRGVTDFGKHLAGEASGLRHLAIDDDLEERVAGSAGLEPLQRAGERVRRAVWDPLFPVVSDAKHILVAPDGLLGLLPFDLLPVRGGELLLDAFLISNIGSGRDVIRFADRSSSSPSEPVIFCAPDFDFAESSKPAAAPQRDFVRGVNRLGVTRVSPLPGAKLEGHKIQQLLPGSRIYEGASATESAMRGLRSPLALHIATHGFSASPTDDSDNDEGMFHAGLVFAGANAALLGIPNDASAGDAILTGEEAATLNLMGTELVVLSACRSGLGKTVPGEGVFGLHRAFASAGARCVITSLWKIPDTQTTDLMTCLYQELIRGSSRAAALREAKRHMRTDHPHPFFWGSFLCHGDWREIPQFARLTH